MAFGGVAKPLLVIKWLGDEVPTSSAQQINPWLRAKPPRQGHGGRVETARPWHAGAPEFEANTLQRLRRVIVIADVVGYSSLFEVDEIQTILLVRRLWRDIVRPLAKRHAATHIRFVGDSALCAFVDAVNAIECTLAIQETLSPLEKDRSYGSRLSLRIGISAGEIWSDGHDIHGQSINVAARLQVMAEPGEVLVCGKTLEETGDRFAPASVRLGTRKLKNLARSVEVYRIPATSPLRRQGSSLSQAAP